MRWRSNNVRYRDERVSSAIRVVRQPTRFGAPPIAGLAADADLPARLDGRHPIEDQLPATRPAVTLRSPWWFTICDGERYERFKFRTVAETVAKMWSCET